MVEDADITWVDEPDFRLIREDRMFNSFECVRPGYALLDYTIRVDFKEGWKTDVTSTPIWFRALVPQLGPHAPAALLHDRLLEMGFSRTEARAWMKRQLELLPDVKKARRFAMRAGVWTWDEVGWPLRSAWRRFRS